MSSKPAPSPEIFQSQEAAFVKHYDWLLRWALQFTNQDRERAKDLVQQVFAQFALAHTDLSAVHDISAYLYTTLRNTHLSEVRLAGRSHSESQSIVEYSVADAALGASDPYTLFQTQDHLRRVCLYACLRKQSSRAGSVLILRFFHGYHVSEIAEVLGGTCQAVRQSLKFARNEARLFLDDPGALKFIARTQTANVSFTGTVCSADELLAELRRAIFRSCEGECFDSDSLRALYTERLIVTADNATLAHIVSCAKCLDAINHKLGLPLLAERHPADALGPNNNWRGGPGSSGSSGGTEQSFQSRLKAKHQAGENSRSMLLECRRRATEFFEHHPGELSVSVNGHVLGSQSVSSRTSRLRLDVAITEPLAFVEIMGDERTRLLVMTIEPPPAGGPTQERRVRLSEGRYLEAILRHGHPWPMLEVIYHDPDFNNESLPSTLDPDGAWSLDSAGNPVGFDDELEDLERNRPGFPQLQVLPTPESPSEVSESAHLRPSPAAGFFDLFRGLSLLGRPFWTRPGFVSAFVSVLLIGVLLFLRFNLAPTVTAASLIERAGALESMPVGPELAVHRVVSLEKRRHSSGETVSRSRIETWQNGDSGLSVRRVYDDQGKLIIGEWVSHSETEGKSLRRIYRRDQPEQIEPLARNAPQSIRNHELWQLEISAREFAEVVRVEAANVSERSGVYVIDYSSGTSAQGLSRAILTLRKDDLHPIAQTFIIGDGIETYEYRFAELSFERPRLQSVSPNTFQPDSELILKAPGVGKVSRREVEPESLLPPPPVTATAALEVEVAYALDRFRTLLGDQLVLTKTPAGVLEVKGVVDGEETRKEILDALGQVSKHPAVRIEISTVAEVLARQQKQPNGVVREFRGSDNAIPVYPELKRYFTARAGAGAAEENVDQLVREFAARVVGQSRRALGHALELRQLTTRFSDKQLSELTPSTRAKWSGLVRNHAEALRREVSNLHGELRPIFFQNQNRLDALSGMEISSDAGLLLAVERLHKLVLVTDEAVRSAFAASSGAASGQQVKSSGFHIDLMTSERLAERIRAAANE